MKLKVAIIGTNGLPGKYGGWDQLVIHLTENLRDKFDFLVYTSYSTINNKAEYNGTKLKKIPFKANGVQSIPYDIYSIIHALFVCDVLFICGTSGCIFLPIAKLFGKKIVLNPDGQEWRRGKWSKPVQWFLKLSEKWGIKNATSVVSDNVKIQEYISNVYKKDSFLIEYGGDHVIKVPLSNETATKYNIKSQEYAFKVCRIEPENNIDLILKSFYKNPKMPLVLIGNWKNSEYGANLQHFYSDCDNLILLDPIYDQVTLDELRSNCGFYIHGHSVGGTNPSLVEAMNLGLNIFAFGVNYNIETTENKASYFTNSDQLQQLISDFFSNKLVSNSDSMYTIAKRRYLWSIITEKYSNVFQS
jgi:glycosyltransferase involved in cell wall biosynthesis